MEHLPIKGIFFSKFEFRLLVFITFTVIPKIKFGLINAGRTSFSTNTSGASFLDYIDI